MGTTMQAVLRLSLHIAATLEAACFLLSGLCAAGLWPAAKLEVVLNLTRSTTAIAGVLWVAVGLAGCNNKEADTTKAQAEPGVAADNTGKNERDRSVNALTPGDQGESEADRGITQRARKGVLDADLSVNASNVKIITNDGVVTLRGPVSSAAEKASVVRIVGGIDGVKRVEDHLELTAGQAAALPQNNQPANPH